VSRLDRPTILPPEDLYDPDEEPTEPHVVSDRIVVAVLVGVGSMAVLALLFAVVMLALVFHVEHR
jgi:hypothetical protein